MSTYLRPITLDLSPEHSGLVGTLSYKVISADGATTYIASTTAGITESPAGSGSYRATPTFDNAWGWVVLDWSTSTFNRQLAVNASDSGPISGSAPPSGDPLIYWPTDDDLTAFFLAMWPDMDTTALSTILAGSAAAALHEFENQTGREPFLAGSTPSTAYYDPPGAIASASPTYTIRGGRKLLPLRTSYVSISSVAIGCTNSNPTGSPMTAGVNYFTLPKGGPEIDAIEFAIPVWGVENSIAITGIKGYATPHIPSDAWLAVRNLAAAQSAASVIQVLSEGLTSVSQGSAKLSIALPDLEASADRWRQQAMRVIFRYKRVALGV